MTVQSGDMNGSEALFVSDIDFRAVLQTQTHLKSNHEMEWYRCSHYQPQPQYEASSVTES